MTTASNVISFKYKNHKGEVRQRVIEPHRVEYRHKPGYGYEPGWFVTGFCTDKQAPRSFALANIIVPDDPTDSIYALLVLRWRC